MIGALIVAASISAGAAEPLGAAGHWEGEPPEPSEVAVRAGQRLVVDLSCDRPCRPTLTLEGAGWSTDEAAEAERTRRGLRVERTVPADGIVRMAFDTEAPRGRPLTAARLARRLSGAYRLTVSVDGLVIATDRPPVLPTATGVDDATGSAVEPTPADPALCDPVGELIAGVPRAWTEGRIRSLGMRGDRTEWLLQTHIRPSTCTVMVGDHDAWVGCTWPDVVDEVAAADTFMALARGLDGCLPTWTTGTPPAGVSFGAVEVDARVWRGDGVEVLAQVWRRRAGEDHRFTQRLEIRAAEP